jgi:hypothetical protein
MELKNEEKNAHIGFSVEDVDERRNVIFNV